MSGTASEQSARLRAAGPHAWEVRGGFEAPVRLLAIAPAAQDRCKDGTLAALRGVAALPGIVPPLIALPAIACAHGVPSATVLITDPDDNGVVVPAAIGHEIGNGVRAVALPWEAQALRAQSETTIAALAKALLHAGPDTALDDPALDAACLHGAAWASRAGWGQPEDAAACDGRGVGAGADPTALSAIARARAQAQFGILAGGGAHAAIVETARRPEPGRFGLVPGQAVLIIAAGSGGLGQKVTEDAIERMVRTALQHRIALTQRALACAPVHSREGRDYLAAMAAVLNFAAAHRQCLAHRACTVLANVMGKAMPHGAPRLLTDHPHQSARMQLMQIGGAQRRVLVHRKACIALKDDPQRPRLLVASTGGAWLVLPGPAAQATHHSACPLTIPGAWQAQRDAKIVTAVAKMDPVLRVAG